MWYWSGMFVGKGDQSGRVSSFISAVVVVVISALKDTIRNKETIVCMGYKYGLQ